MYLLLDAILLSSSFINTITLKEDFTTLITSCLAFLTTILLLDLYLIGIFVDNPIVKKIYMGYLVAFLIYNIFMLYKSPDKLIVLINNIVTIFIISLFLIYYIAQKKMNKF